MFEIANKKDSHFSLFIEYARDETWLYYGSIVLKKNSVNGELERIAF